MHFSLGTFLFQLINFLVLVVILDRLLYRPLRAAIDRRREEDARARAEAEGARKEAEALQRQLDAKLAEIDRGREEAIRAAREQADAERKRLLAEAERGIARRREEFEQEVARRREEALRSLRGELARSAVALAERLLREAADADLNRRLVGRLAEALEAIPPPERERLREEWTPEDGAVVEAAAPFNGEVLGRLEAAVGELLGRPVPLTVATDPDLLGGARLRLGGRVWDATLADRLEEAAQAASGGKAP